MQLFFQNDDGAMVEQINNDKFIWCYYV